jgi:4-amino-4-deoxy-L-arabinose transferase-like glycosyltransferase
VLLALALAVAGIGIRQLPLDGHEVFVAQTAQEMLQRGDWLVPYFNGEPRLTKPPLNYWLTALFAALGGAERVLPEHARMISVLAGTGVAALLLAAGRLLFPEQGRTAVGAALLLVSSVGFYTFTHDGRSDMLYTLLCMGGVTGFLTAWRRDGEGKPAGCTPYLAWLCYGLATLAKGPHMPALFLLAYVGFALYLRLPWRKVLALFCPLGGLALLAAVALPWWWLLRREVGAEVLAASQLSGTLLTGHGKYWFSPFYFYRSLPLLAPWLAPLLAALAGIRRVRPEPATVLLLSLVFVPAIALGFGSQQRPVYILPVLPWLFLLLARFATAPAGPLAERILAWALPVQWLLILVGGGWLWFRTEPALTAQFPALPLLAVIGTLWLACLAWRRLHKQNLWPDIAGTAVVACVVGILAGPTPLVWGEERYARPLLENSLREMGAAGIPIVSLDESSEIYVYFAGRPVEYVADAGELARYLDNKETVAVIARPEAAEQFPPNWDRRVLARMPPMKESRAVFLLHRSG